MSDHDPIVPRLGGWNFKPRERQLWESAQEALPTLTLAHKSRQTLADVVRQLGDRLEVDRNTERLVAKADRLFVRQLAATQLGALGVRSLSAMIVLISTGYEPESMAHMRTGLEVLIRMHQVVNEHDGESARKILQGQRPGGLKHVARKYKNQREVEILDHFAHADALLLRTLEVGHDGMRPLIELKPTRGQLRPASWLHEASMNAVQTAVGVCEVFGVALQLPRSLGGQLEHWRDNPLPAPL